MSNYQILIIGGGSIGERHLRCFQQTGRVEVAVCDRDPRLLATLKGTYGVPTFESLEEALQHFPCDGVVICTPAHLHVSMAQSVLEANKHVLIEKPLSTGLQNTDALVREAKSKGLVAAVAYVTRFNPVLQEAREFLRSTDFGPALQVNVVSGQHFPTFRPAYRDIYYAKHDLGGGAIQDALTHFANAVEWLLGATDSLFCDASHQALEGVEVEDTVHVVARNERALVSYSLNQFQAPSETTLGINCEKGSVRIELHRQRWGFLRQGDEAWIWHDVPVAQRDALFTAQAAAFVAALDGKETDLCSLEEGIQTLKFNLAALESARSGIRMVL